MYIVKFGSGSEFLKLEIPPDFSVEGWFDVSVEIKTNKFQGNINISIETWDILNFLNSLEELYKSLKGSASFETREEQLNFKLESKVGGHIEVSGVAWSEARYGSKLVFIFSLDQTFLLEPLSTLRLFSSQLNIIPN